MEENNKVIVFEKKEIILVLIFVVILIVTSFTVGIRLGKKLSMADAGIEESHVKTLELKSNLEEEADKSVEIEAQLTDDEKLKKMMEESKTKLNEELEKFSTEEPKTEATAASTPEATKTETAPQSTMIGKYTVQLGSYNTLEEAKQFAEGFTVRGYNPIINEVKIPEKGVWYRVSLGIFNSVEEAKKYIQSEQSLFAGQDHIITEIR